MKTKQKQELKKKQHTNIFVFYPIFLSQKMFAYPSIGIPNILILYLRDMSCSVANCSAINSDPKVEGSTVFCFFENQDTGALLMYISMSVCDCRVSLSLIRYKKINEIKQNIN
jgi:hypothetical protein